ncbi:MAG: LD-carboxypeptidase [Ancrocorticia sp.]|uniref:LD-carboxypeptidase n=1 Tax=Ancrocorticia sp. TaxID=2593684 RepID=UPI003F917456
MARLALTSCSNPTLPWTHSKLPALHEALARAGHTLDSSAVETLAEAARRSASGNSPERWNPRARAQILMDAFLDPSVEGIIDISGGDLANEVLPHLDMNEIAAHPKLMVGYSDISCILGSLPFPSLLWNPIVGLTEGFGQLDQALASQRIRPGTSPMNTNLALDNLPALPWAGGNIRCFLKLAGTPFWPDLTGRVLLIEGQGPKLNSVAALLAHHAALGTFEKIAAIVVGQFTHIDDAGERPALLKLVAEYAHGPVAEAPSIGHSSTSGAVTLN